MTLSNEEWLRVQLEMSIADKVKKIEPENGVELLVGLLSSLCSLSQLAALVTHLKGKIEL